MEAALLSLPLATLQQYLSEAITSRHKIVTGQKPSYVSHGQNARTYKIDNLSELDQYISSLQATISAKEAGKTRVRAPIQLGVGYRS